MGPKNMRIGAIGLILATLAVAGVILFDRSRVRAASDVIVGRSEALGGEPWLLPNLDNALVVQPDRPHSFQEVHAWRSGEDVQIKRTRSYRLSTNRLGLRGPELGPKKAGTLRIIALGDSVTHGWGVSREESYPARLAERLARAGLEAEVINAGVPANPISVMQRWCERVAPSLSPDVVLWTRRPANRNPDPYGEYVRAIRSCRQATGATLMAVLPPISTFDVRGSAAWESEYSTLKARLGPHQIDVLELTPAFRAAQAGRGEILVQRGQKLVVVDQETGSTRLEADPSAHDLPAAIYTLFETDPAVREALFFDDGHPDAEGFVLFAETVADALLERLTAPEARPPPAPEAPPPAPSDPMP